MPSRILNRLINRLEIWLDLIGTYPLRSAMKHCGRNVTIKRGMKANFPGGLTIGNNVFLGEFCWFSFLSENVQKGAPNIALSPTIDIGNNCYVGRFATFACMNHIEVGNDVMISDRVFVGDCHHGYADPRLPVRDQYMFSPGTVSIGDGSWIGINVAIMPNVKIGKHCVVGANSVVTRDIPDFHVAAGAPARILKTIGARLESGTPPPGAVE